MQITEAKYLYFLRSSLKTMFYKKAKFEMKSQTSKTKYNHQFASIDTEARC